MQVKNIVFDLWYRLGKPVWVIDEPQPDLMAAVSEGVIQGPSILDVGCGAGDNAVYLAERKFSVTGVDVSAAAIAIAERKAHKSGVDATFVRLDAFQFGALAKKFDTVIDFGLFHQFGEQSRMRYVSSLRDVCRSEGQLLLQCFSDQGGRTERFGPRLIS